MYVDMFTNEIFVTLFNSVYETKQIYRGTKKEDWVNNVCKMYFTKEYIVLIVYGGFWKINPTDNTNFLKIKLKIIFWV